MKKKTITDLYRQFRKENENKKPNRVIVRMHWEDDPDNSLVDTIAIVPLKQIGWAEDDCYILWYASSLNGLRELTTPNNGSDFIVDEVLEFYRA